jgi:hypothetical protein
LPATPRARKNEKRKNPALSSVHAEIFYARKHCAPPFSCLFARFGDATTQASTICLSRLVVDRKCNKMPFITGLQRPDAGLLTRDVR